MEVSPLFYALGLLHALVIGAGLWELKKINRVIEKRENAQGDKDADASSKDGV